MVQLKFLNLLAMDRSERYGESRLATTTFRGETTAANGEDDGYQTGASPIRQPDG